jgi:ribosomal protein S18 acetylase RimI-like enzyme
MLLLTDQISQEEIVEFLNRFWNSDFPGLHLKIVNGKLELGKFRKCYSLVIVDEQTGGVIAHVAVSSHFVSESSADITYVVVDRRHRRCGFARLLMEEAIRIAREAGCECVRLHAEVHRKSARRLYQSLGFVLMDGSTKSFELTL